MISYGITVCNEFEEIQILLPFLIEHKSIDDEIVILFDTKNGDNRIVNYIATKQVKLILSDDFDNDFSKWKNLLNSYCNGDYILQLDADELISSTLINSLNDFIVLNPMVDLFFLPRINIITDISDEQIKKWGWCKNNKNQINYPDYQGRFYRKNLQWFGNVHERIVGHKVFTHIPEMCDELSILHIKKIDKQIKQNNLYEHIISSRSI
jgi:hypothetical protein